MPSYPLSRDAGRAVPLGMRLEDDGRALVEQDNYKSAVSRFLTAKYAKGAKILLLCFVSLLSQNAVTYLSRDAGRAVPSGMLLEATPKAGAGQIR